MGVFVQGSTIKRESVRAKIQFGEHTWLTPDVINFSINIGRTELSKTFSASVIVSGSESLDIQQRFNQAIDDENDNVGNIRISAAYSDGSSVPDNWVKLFTGFVRQMSVKRSFSRPNSFIVDLSGSDVFYKLENRTYSRRVYSSGLGVFGLITGIVRKGGGNTGRYSVISEIPMKASGRGKSPSPTVIGIGSSPTFSDGNAGKVVRYNKGLTWFTSGQPSTRGVTNAGAVDSLQISPAFVMTSPNQSYSFSCTSGCTETDDSTAYLWSVEDVAAGGILNGDQNVVSSVTTGNPGSGITYKQLSYGSNIIKLTEISSGKVGKAFVITLPNHDHSEMGQGGPSFGTYASIEAG